MLQMLRDRLINLYYKLRDVAGKNRKLVMPLVLLVCVVITVGLAFGLRRLHRAASQGASMVISLSADEIELELNAYEAVNELVETYYQAAADGDTETIASISLTLSEEESIRIQELGNYIDCYTTIDVYTKTGPYENTYIAYVYTVLKLVDHDWEIPGMQTMYICMRDNGELYINNSETQTEEAAEYIQLASLQDDVVDLNNQIAAQYNDLLAGDEELSEYLDQMASLIDISVGQQLAQLDEESGESSQSQTTEETVYVEAIAEDINIRESPSADGEWLGTAQLGDQFTLVEERSDGWLEILYNGESAYVKSEYFSIVE